MNSTLTLPATVTPTAARPAKSVARFVTPVVRVLLGLLLFVSGLNGFLNFLPQPTTPLPEKALAFVGALMSSGYMLPLIFATLLAGGALLLVNRFVALALVILAPFIVNSVAFHAFLEPTGLVMAGIVAAMELYLAWAYRRVYRPLFVPTAS